MCGPTPPVTLMIRVPRVAAPETVEVYGADRLDFWNDPLRWRGITDPQKQMIWDKPNQRRIVTHVDEEVKQIWIWVNGRYQASVDSTRGPQHLAHLHRDRSHSTHG